MTNVITLLSDANRTDLTGDRLWMDRLKPVPGFIAERISFITYCNVEAPHLLSYDFYLDGVQIFPELLEYIWTPCAIRSVYTAGSLSISEKKYIGRDDVAISVLDITNQSENAISLNYQAHTLLAELKKQARALYNPSFISADNRNGDTVGFRMNVDCIARNVLRQNVDVRFCFHVPGATVSQDNDTFDGGFVIESGETKRITAVCSCFTETKPAKDNWLRILARSEDILERNDIAFCSWFDENVPGLSCSDSKLEKLYYYRWYVVYKNIITPGVDCFQQECIYEGKDQFAQICTGSAAMQMRDARWMKQGKLAISQLNMLLKSQITDGLDAGRFRDMYLNDIPFTAWETCCMTGREDIYPNVLEPLRRFVDWESSDIFVKDESLLPVVTGSWRTAAEYQPSFFEFTNPPWDHTQSNPFGNEHKTAVHRVEEAVYLYQNFRAVAKMAEAAGSDKVAEEYNKHAQALKINILRCMWDKTTKFFYDLRPGDFKKAMNSKNFAGFLPARCDIADDLGDGLFAHLLEEFNAPYPVPTAATDSPAFSTDNTWRIGPHASEDKPYHYDCCWNGPSWNFANSLIIDALGSYIQRNNAKQLSETFTHLFLKWCEEQTGDGDAIPNSCEHYNPFTGEPLRDVKDYFHSSFIDIVMKYVAGIGVAGENAISVAPIDIGLKMLSLTGIPFRQHTVDFLWNSEKEEDRLIIKIDGKTEHKGNSIEPITLILER